ncbi:MAG: DUF1592 domain-containing protein [Lentisphaeraceae bacterium]|nr:DUF1592 domain-containing protein [Lentisphaeraceae bacterium]
MKILTIFLLCLYYIPTTIANNFSLSQNKKFTTLLKTYCYDCHSDGVNKGDLDFDSLSHDLSDPETLAKWVIIYDRTMSGEMPPKKKKKRPNLDDLKSFHEVLNPALCDADSQKNETILRRLNVQEYENTINDIFGTKLHISDILAEDSLSHEFDNIGSALGLSTDQLNNYIEIARKAMQASFLSKPLPKSTTKTVTYSMNNDISKFLGNSWKKLPDGAIVRFNDGGYPSGVLNEARIREAGVYRIKVKGYAHQSKKPISFKVGGRIKSHRRQDLTYGYFSFPADKVSTVEVTAYIEEGYRIAIEPHGIPELDHSSRKKNKLDISTYTGPGLAILEVEFTGPLNPFPKLGHELTFAGLDRQRVKSKEKSRPRGSDALYEINTNEPIAVAQKILLRVARKAFRRDDVEIAPYLDLFRREINKGKRNEAALRMAVTAIFSSTEFIYFRENPGPLDDYALASRLSYFLNRTLPDEELLNKARKGHLKNDPKSRIQEVNRLIKDEKFERFLTDFTNAWLNLREINATAPDDKLFPEFDDYLKHSMARESKAFLREMIVKNLAIKNIVKSDFAMLNERLAKHYGIDGVKGSEIRPVKLPTGSIRGGFLSQASVLKVSANGTNTSPVVRGIWVMERILGQHPSPAPANIPGVEPDIRGAQTLREILDKHRSTQSCNSCHKKIDPLGFALEVFNPIGGERSHFRSYGKHARKVDTIVKGKKVRYKLGSKVDASGIMEDGQKYENFQQFRDILANQEELLAKAMTTKIITFATGRTMGFADRAEIQKIVNQAATKNYRLLDLIHLAVNSKIFLYK